MPQHDSLALISEIVLRCTAKVCHDIKPDKISNIADPLIDAVVDMVAFQTEEKPTGFSVKTNHYVSFELFNRILDEIAKEIPCADRVNVWCENMNRTQRRDYLDRYGDTTAPRAAAG
jgi:hypothetical protein